MVVQEGSPEGNPIERVPLWRSLVTFWRQKVTARRAGDEGSTPRLGRGIIKCLNLNNPPDKKVKIIHRITGLKIKCKK